MLFTHLNKLLLHWAYEKQKKGGVGRKENIYPVLCLATQNMGLRNALE